MERMLPIPEVPLLPQIHQPEQMSTSLTSPDIVTAPVSGMLVDQQIIPTTTTCITSTANTTHGSTQRNYVSKYGCGNHHKVTKKFDPSIWDENFSKLQNQITLYGKNSTPENPALIKWINQQKKEYRILQSKGSSKLSPSQIQRLNDIGFVFTSRRKYGSWEERMKEFQEFVTTNGHSRVPVLHPTLGSWVHAQRRHYKLYIENDPKSKMTEEKINELKSAGFLFEIAKKTQQTDARSNSKSWDERFEELKEFQSQFGHTVVPQHYPKLGWWVNAQRKEHKKLITGKKSALTSARLLTLIGIGFVFDASGKKGNTRENGSSAGIETPPTGFMENDGVDLAEFT